MAKDLSGAQTGVVQRASVNDPRPSAVGGRNEFPQTYKHLTTDRYGEFSPFYWAKAERGDVQNLHAVHDLHTYTLASPMVSDVKMTKSFFKIPMQAIYPRNWEKMMTIPTQGDDVPSDTRALLDYTTLLTYVVTVIKSSSDPEHLRYCFTLLELLGSYGSLFYRFNQHVNVILTDGSSYFSVDTFMDDFYRSLLDFASRSDLNDIGFSDDNGESYIISSRPVSESLSVHHVSSRRFIELFRNPSYSFLDVEDWRLYIDDILSGMTYDITNLSVYKSYDSVQKENDPINSRYLNIEPIISYQLSCAQFGTNDFVDFVYSAQLYRDNMQSLYTSFIDPKVPSFLYNGVESLYDVFSQKIFGNLISNITSNPRACLFFINLFSYQNSLRYGDYFTGAKPRPLAVGEYSAQVNNNQVSAIDITRSIQMQRLLNRVNMVGRKLGDYLSGIFGGPIPSAPKDVPIFLAHQKYDIKGFEVNNTGDRQFSVDEPNTITSQLRSAENRHVFEIEIDEPCYIIGVNSYETPRIYSLTMDKFSFHHDRYDDFLPQNQYIGDQDINVSEINSLISSSVPYAYTLRYMEYKLRYSYASGGFIKSLPSWAFVTDNEDGNPPSNVINPEFIRSSPSEFDRFYKSLTGYSLGNYFHFIVVHTNVTSPSRMMEYTPEILK